MSNTQQTPNPPEEAAKQTLTIAELTTVLIKHYGIKEGLYEASFGIGITVGGFQPVPNEPPYPGAAVFVQSVSLQAVPIPSPHSVDASKVSLVGDRHQDVPQGSKG
ncbi:hypothetical protein [Roseateles saccharophilus]|uniref:Uncharacterized protein n=1 Tax=Roseateles saccharophilus TaxID=304 RepID=A0A4R3UMW8_ROSSA|nr:hypothetical protein [Roseateles saccharophilus]MDG0833776.1 hypothetical protein [Roseateles saccharophilus]TCU91598.1 hypothetical protein EV671_102577 [Roseateles saccharophilus]